MRPFPRTRLALILLAGLPVTAFAEDIYILRFNEPAALQEKARAPELEHLQAERLADLERRIGRAPDVVFQYVHALNGAAVRLTADEARQAARLAGIAAVTRDRLYPLLTDRSPDFLGATAVWNGTATGGLAGTQGEGILVGIIDSGINLDHPSFSDTPPDAYTYVNPNGPGVFLGWCDPMHPDYDPSYVCNDKLIGAWDYADAVSGGTEANGPEDAYNHGSNIAAIAAGNNLLWPPISGIAPHAQIIAYDACYWSDGLGNLICPGASMLAAINQAIADDVDVINMSIAGGENPYNDPVELALLDAVAADIAVVVSAGNDGPEAGSVLHNSPWVTTVAATSHDRTNNTNSVGSFTGGMGLLGDLGGQSLTCGYGPASIVLAGDCSTPFAPGTWTGGEIAVCNRANFELPITLCENVAAGGAAGCVVADEAGAFATISVYSPIPFTHLASAEGDQLRAWLMSGAGHQATLTDTGTVLGGPGDRVRDFSSRGPNRSLDLLKPSLAAPGFNILAAGSFQSLLGTTTQEFIPMTGTSQASPQVAGAAALLRALYPAWSPAEIQSALMTTAANGLVLEDGITAATPFDEGSGRLDLNNAGRVGLVLNETVANYTNADPALGGDPRDLNVASISTRTCHPSCSFVRTFKSTAAGSVNWTVDGSADDLGFSFMPANFVLANAGDEQSVTITITPAAMPGNLTAFGEVVLTPDDEDLPTARLPVVVQDTEAIFVDGFEYGDTAMWSATTP